MSVSYKPIDSHSYLLSSFSHPNQPKQSTPYLLLILAYLPPTQWWSRFWDQIFGNEIFFVKQGYPTYLFDIAI